MIQGIYLHRTFGGRRPPQQAAIHVPRGSGARGFGVSPIVHLCPNGVRSSPFIEGQFPQIERVTWYFELEKKKG